MSLWDLDQSMVFVPCPGQPACPHGLYEVDGHRHFMRARGKVWVRRLVPGCWEAVCPCCSEQPVLAQVSSWGLAMWRANGHLAEVHTAAPGVPPGVAAVIEWGEEER